MDIGVSRTLNETFNRHGATTPRTDSLPLFVAPWRRGGSSVSSSSIHECELVAFQQHLGVLLPRRQRCGLGAGEFSGGVPATAVVVTGDGFGGRLLRDRQSPFERVV